MMKHKSNRPRFNNLRDYFSRIKVEEFNDAIAVLNKILRDPTNVSPGDLTIVFLTPFNSSWKWDLKNYNLVAREVWSDENFMSELRVPIDTDTLISLLLREITEDTVNFEDGNDPDYVFDYQRSIANLAEDPCKVLKVLAQILVRIEISNRCWFSRSLFLNKNIT